MKNKLFKASCALAAFLSLGSLARQAGAACAVPVEKSVSSDTLGGFNVKPNRPTLAQSGDSSYANRICNDGFVNDMVWAYDMDAGNWNDGRGWEAYCDGTRIFGRSLAALWALNFSSKTQASSWDDLSGNPLQWAGNYAHLSFDELDGECYWDSKANATTVSGPIVDNYTNLYHGFHYGMPVVTRASVLLHESRHADGYSHDGNDGAVRCIDQSDSCDETFYLNANSGPQSVTKGGAMSYEVVFLHWFHDAAVNTTTAQRNLAKDRGNYVLANRFDSRPAYRL
jgi:hypothetical protein